MDICKKCRQIAAFVFAMLLLLGSTTIVTNAADGTVTKTLSVQYGQTEAREMLKMVNDFRTGGENWYWNEDNQTKSNCKGSTLVYDYELEKAAMLRAAEIAYNYKLHHTRPNGEDCFTAYEGTTRYAGENIAYGYTTAEAVFTAWQEKNDKYNGQGHRRNMLSDDFTAFAVGHVYYNGTHYWVQEFRSPASQMAATPADDSTRTVSIEVKGHNHVWDKGTVTKKATCTEVGEKKYTCTECDETRTETIPKTGHNEVVDPAVAATCTTAGKTEGSHCSICNTVIKAQTELPALGHKEEIKNKKSATCEEDGYTGDKVCTVCGEILEKGSAIPKTGHKWDSGKLADGATCETGGVITYTCTKCGGTKTETIGAAEHKTETKNKTEASCTEAGYTGNEVCIVCGKEVSKGENIPALGHSFGEWKQIASPDCENTGSDKRVCSVCAFTETRGLDIKGHVWETDYTIDKEAACTTDGSKSIHCSKCDAVKDSQVIPKGHQPILTNQKDATCIEAGYTGEQICKLCNTVLEKGNIVPAKGHVKENVAALEATCTESGHEAGIRCTVCGETLEGLKVIPAKGHQWDNGVITTEPTRQTEGVKTYTCQICKITRTEIIEKLPNYKIIKGAGSTWVMNSNKELTFCADADISLFVEVRIDGSVVDPKNYSVTSGSTIVSLKPSYLNTLKDGAHTIEIIFKDGKAATTFKIAKQSSNSMTTAKNTTSSNSSRSPKTGDLTDAGIYILLLGMSVIAILGVWKRKMV